MRHNIIPNIWVYKQRFRHPLNIPGSQWFPWIYKGYWNPQDGKKASRHQESKIDIIANFPSHTMN